MTRQRSRSTTAEISTGIAQPVRRPWAFTKGFIAGAVVVIPAIAATVWGLAKLGMGDPELRLLSAIRVSTLFIGVAAVITAGGVGRLAAQAATEHGATPRRPLVVAARAFACAGAGLTVIAAIPFGHLPDHWPGFIVIALAGAATGALCGAVIGAVCGGAAPIGLTDVMALARWPTDALRSLLEPEDLAAVAGAPKRKRRITIPFLFPAPKPPTVPPGDKPSADASASASAASPSASAASQSDSASPSASSSASPSPSPSPSASPTANPDAKEP